MQCYVEDENGRFLAAFENHTLAEKSIVFSCHKLAETHKKSVTWDYEGSIKVGTQPDGKKVRIRPMFIYDEVTHI